MNDCEKCDGLAPSKSVCDACEEAVEDKYDDMPTAAEIEKYQRDGHTFHCAMRILTGDGECECGKNEHIPGGISRAMYQGVCLICLAPKEEEHKHWCKNGGIKTPCETTITSNRI